VWIPTETDQHIEVLGHLLTQVTASGNLVSDAHVAALAIEHGLTLCSTDHDFARFPSLRFQNPLAP
jgi:predicted nucleic acid-binding protein